MFDDQEFASRFREALNQTALTDFTLSFAGGAGEDDAPLLPTLRMSGMGKCARRLYYDLIATTVVRSVGNPWQNILGYAGQAIVAKTLQTMGYTLFNEEKLVEYAGVPGHTDGQLTGLDLGKKKAIWDCKLRNGFALRDIIRDGLMKAEPDTYIQQQGYIAAEGADLGIVTVHPFDLTDAKSRLKTYKIDQDILVTRIIIKPNKKVHELISTRASMIRFAASAKVVPDREFDPLGDHERFPCGFCEHLNTCLAQGETRQFTVAPLEFKDGDK